MRGVGMRLSIVLRKSKREGCVANDDSMNGSDSRFNDVSFSVHSMPELPDPTEKDLSGKLGDVLNNSERGTATRRESHQRQRRVNLIRMGSSRQQSHRASLFGREMIQNTTSKPKSILRVGRNLNRMAKHLTDRVRKNKAVQINERKNQVSGIERVQDLSTEIIESVWYTDTEITDMKREMDLIAAAMDDGATDVEGRGLEARTEQGNWLAYKARLDATNAVLDEQDRQMSKGRRHAVVKLDDAQVREVYLEVSASYSEQALKRGQQDEKDTMELLFETRKEYVAWVDQQEAYRVEQLAKMFFKEPVANASLAEERWQDAEHPHSSYSEQDASHSNSHGDGPMAISNGATPEQALPCTKLHDRGLVGISNKNATPEQSPEQAPLTLFGKRQSWLSHIILERKAGRMQRKHSWFVRAKGAFDTSGETRALPGVGLTTVNCKS